MDDVELSNIEIDLFLRTLQERFGYDFTEYAKASIRRRVQGIARSRNCHCISELIPWVLSTPGAVEEVLARISVPVTEMFRDPDVFLFVREQIVPELEIHPVINIWQAGSATGEEAYSLAIMLSECGLGDRVRIYATDINDEAIRRAEEAVYPTEQIKAYAHNYLHAGGSGSLNDYFTVGYKLAKLSPRIRGMVYFSHHNLVTDGSFNEFQLIFCRNVLIYFNAELQRRVMQLFCNSLAWDGVLCLGNREAIRDESIRSEFEPVNESHRVYRYLPSGKGRPR